MHELYPEVPVHKHEHRPLSSNVIWVLACGALAITGYFYGLDKGRGSAGVALGTYHAPNTADNGLPIGPSIGGNTAPGDLLARARLENELLYTDLQSFICDEQIDRYKASLNGEQPHQIDTVNAKVSFENGVENYSDIRENDRFRPSLSSLPGAWSEGEFGTLLRQTRALLATQPVSEGDTYMNGVPTSIYTFRVSGEESPWDLAVGSRQYRVPFRTDVWVSKSSGQIVKIARTTTAIPAESGISEIEWAVVLKPVDLEGKFWLLPSSGEYSVVYQNSKRREWNTITFSGYHRYASRSVIHF
jgi:hypothetical protein